MTDFIQTVVIGLANGSIYATLALALVLIHRATGIINFAQGEMGMFATFIAWALIYHHGFPYWAAFFVTLGLVWYETNAWLAGFVFLFTLFVAIGSWWEERQLRRINETALRSCPAEKILLNAHYAEVGRRTPELLRSAFIIAAVIPAVLAYA